MNSVKPLLSVRDLKTYFFMDEGVVKAVDGVSFDVFSGQVFGIVGESGCGKTTLLKSFNRFLELPWLKYLGKISYGLYVYHFVLIFFAGRMNDFVSLPYEQVQMISAVPAFIATVGVAVLSFKYLEKPIINLKDKFFPSVPVRVPPASEAAGLPSELNDANGVS